MKQRMPRAIYSKEFREQVANQVTIIVINLIFLLIGHGDWVPAKFHWLNKLFFWR